MGLDVVELILRVEETFEVAIPDEQAAKLTTVGDLFDHLKRAESARRSPRQVLGAAFYEIRRACVRTLGTERAALRPETPLERVFPRMDRRAAWRRVSSALERPSRGLAPPGWLIASVVGVSGAAALAAGSALGLVAAFWGGAASAVLGVAATRSFWTEFPAGARTLGDLARAHRRDHYGAA